jgi:hypothetical protein
MRIRRRIAITVEKFRERPDGAILICTESLAEAK